MTGLFPLRDTGSCSGHPSNSLDSRGHVCEWKGGKKVSIALPHCLYLCKCVKHDFKKTWQQSLETRQPVQAGEAPLPAPGELTTAAR